MCIIETRRLCLRYLIQTDINELMEIWGNPEVMKYSGGAGTYEMEKKSLEFYIGLQKDKGYAPLAVILKESNTFIGVCGFNPPHDGGSLEIMYHLGKPYWGNGYATEASQAILDYAKSSLKLSKLSAYVDPNNKQSIRILEKLGFTYKGIEFHKGSQKHEPFYEIMIS